MVVRQLNYVFFFLVLFMNIVAQMRFGNNEALYNIKFGVFVIHLIFMFLSIVKEKINITRKIKALGLVFYAWFFIMTLSTYQLSSFGDLFSAYLVIASYMLLFIYCFIIFPNYMFYKKISYLSIVRVSYFAILLALLMASLLGYGNPESTHFDPISLRNRYMAFFQHPNTLGLYAFMGICLSYLMFQLTRNKMYLISYPIYIYFIIMSSSRTALYATIGFIVATLCIKYFNNLMRLLRTPLFLTFLIGFILLIVLITDWPSLLQAIDSGTSNRLTVWTELLNQSDSTSKFLFGQGAVKTDASKDSYYVLVLMNSGIVGLGLFLVIVLSVLEYMIKNISSFISSKFTVIYCVFSVYSLVESVFYTLGNVFSLFIWISVAVSICESSAKTEKLSIVHRNKAKNMRGDSIVSSTK